MSKKALKVCEAPSDVYHLTSFSRNFITPSSDRKTTFLMLKFLFMELIKLITLISRWHET